MSVLQQYKCPCCDGAIEFNAQAQKMKCPYCDTEFEIQTLIEYDHVLNATQPENNSWQTPSGTKWAEEETAGLRVYYCNTCGGQIVGDETTAATECPFCGNPVVMMGQFSGDLKPDYVIPFKFDKKAAKEALLNHYKGKRLLPKAFKKENHVDEIKGIYVPFWLYDTDANAHIHFKASSDEYWSDDEYDYEETSYYSVFRAGYLYFWNVPSDASSKIDDTLMESIEPFDFNEAVDFQTAYLSGFFADKFDITAQQGFDRAYQRIATSTEDVFSSTVRGYDRVRIVDNNIKLQDIKVKYVLYPVWLLTSSWKGERYTFAMNGQTGKMVGNLPMDKGLFWKWFCGLTGAVAAAVFLLSWLVNIL